MMREIIENKMREIKNVWHMALREIDDLDLFYEKDIERYDELRKECYDCSIQYNLLKEILEQVKEN